MKILPRKILVPVDFEHGSRRAIRYARALAAAAKADVCLLHVMPMAPSTRPGARDLWWMRLAEQTLAGCAERSRLAPGTTTEVLAGPPAPLIVDYAAKEDFDLIVISTRGTADWHGSLLDSTAAAILRHSRVPVLVVPECRPAAAAAGKSA